MNNFLLRTTFAVCAIATLLGGCHSHSDANAENFTAAVDAYLVEHGDLCLAKTDWPIDVTQREFQTNARNAVQMPVLEHVGLVHSELATATVHDEDKETQVTVKRYQLTDAGRAWYHVHGPNGSRDFCAAHLSLDKVVGWDAPRPGAAAPRVATVSFTYRIDPAPWTRDPEVARVFPMVDRVVRGAGTAQLKQSFILVDGRWTPQGV